MTLVIVTFAVLLVLGSPIGIVLGGSALVYLVANDIPLAILTQRLTQSPNSFPLLASPLFILAGRMMTRAGSPSASSASLSTFSAGRAAASVMLTCSPA